MRGKGPERRHFRGIARGTRRAAHAAMSPTRLRTVLGSVIEASLVSSLLATGACSSDPDVIERSGFGAAAVCTKDANGNPVASLELMRVSVGVDYVARLAQTVVEEAGTPCATAKDQAACAASLAAAKEKNSKPIAGFAANAYVSTRGDEVVEGFGPLGAVIDSPVKVLYAMTTRGYAIGCEPWLRDAGDHYEAIGRIIVKDCAPIVTEEHRVLVRREGSIEILERKEVDRKEGVCAGRRPAGLVLTEPGLAPRGGAAAEVGAWFARVSQLEAASVHAFRVLHDELAHHGAPRSLLRAAKRAARDEIRHAAATARVARRHGVSVPPVHVTRGPVRSLLAIARENATEGCVRETYGAVEASLQASRARDPEIAQLLARIARDELRHAELAWRVASWLRRRLTAGERADVASAVREAASELAEEATRRVSPALRDLVGAPAPAVASGAVARLDAELWSSAA